MLQELTNLCYVFCRVQVWSTVHRELESSIKWTMMMSSKLWKNKNKNNTIKKKLQQKN